MSDPQEPPAKKPLFRRVSFYVGLIVAAGAFSLAGVVIHQTLRSADEDRVVEHLIESEEMILSLTPQLKRLNESFLNLTVPDHNSRELFAYKVSVRDFNGAEGSVSPTAESIEREQLQLCRQLINDVDHFINAKFYFVRGEIPAEGVFESEMGFDALARTPGHGWRSLHGSLEVVWKQISESGDDPTWQISEWRANKVEIEDRSSLMFQEVLDLAIPDAAVRNDARNSGHTQHIIDQHFDGEPRQLKPAYAKYFRAQADNIHPGLAVCDFDNDGWDDIYVARRWTKNLLFHNQQDGTFREMAAEVGLDLEGVTTSAIFADFDNDGDQDVFLGRTLERSAYYSNEDGQYIADTGTRFPYFVASLSAADYNGDGLLDIYLCTYSVPLLELETKEDAARFYPRRVVDRLWKKTRAGDPSARFLNLTGPPNVLLKNVGEGRFVEAPDSEAIELWRPSLQATWADYDNDGDPDLYVANDFSPDNLLRNDGPDGFTDVTLAAGGEAMMGFGMGAGFGDFNLDGKQDLYVSNMYSKAGRRIVAQFDGIDPRFVRSAEGNLLFRKGEGDKFELVSDVKPPGMQVAKAGWSWGGQFADLNNDGWLDIYVGSGYYTAPPAIASDVDL